MEAPQFPRVRVAQTAEDDAKINSPQTQMALALAATGKEYAGRVPKHVVAERRRRNKAARKARRAGRAS